MSPAFSARFSSSRTAPEKPPCSKSCTSPRKASLMRSHTRAKKSAMPPTLLDPATTSPATTAASTPKMRMAGRMVAISPPSVMPAALSPMRRRAKPALAAMTAPTSATTAPAPTTKAAKARFTGAGSCRNTLSTAFTTSTTIVTSGLKTCANGSPATMARVSSEPARSCFCPSKVLSICSRKRAAVPPAFSN